VSLGGNGRFERRSRRNSVRERSDGARELVHRTAELKQRGVHWNRPTPAILKSAPFGTCPLTGHNPTIVMQSYVKSEWLSSGKFVGNLANQFVGPGPRCGEASHGSGSS